MQPQQLYYLLWIGPTFASGPGRPAWRARRDRQLSCGYHAGAAIPASGSSKRRLRGCLSARAGRELNVAAAPARPLQGKPRLPAAIADKSREELQVYVVELLKKLKLRDKKLDGAGPPPPPPFRRCCCCCCCWHGLCAAARC